VNRKLGIVVLGVSMLLATFPAACAADLALSLTTPAAAQNPRVATSPRALPCDRAR